MGADTIQKAARVEKQALAEDELDPYKNEYEMGRTVDL